MSDLNQFLFSNEMKELGKIEDFSVFSKKLINKNYKKLIYSNYGKVLKF
jgi:hypothetical protein